MEALRIGYLSVAVVVDVVVAIAHIFGTAASIDILRW